VDKLVQIILIFFIIQSGFTQQDIIIVSSYVDSTEIKVGEQFKYSIKAESDNINQIVFPENFQFSPFEVADEFAIDTVFFKGKKSLNKSFKLTNFDEGSFVIKPQQILFNGKKYLTDSILIDVRTIKVDTVSKKFFDIKEIILNNEQRIPFSKYLLSFLILVLGLLAIYVLFKKFKNHKFDKSIYKTPFENAIDELVELENESFKNQEDYKLFYSKLTQIAKNYLERDIEISASESTSSQLIDKIQLLKKSKKINISDELIENFKNVLSNSDLVKFAKFSPKDGVAYDDNKFLKSFIVNTKKSIPNNIEKEKEQKRIAEMKFNQMIKKRKIKYSVISIITLIISLTFSVIVLFGAPNISSFFILDADKKLLNKDWVTSTYTDKNLKLDSPDVLFRSNDSSLNKLTYSTKNNSLEINLITQPLNENSDPINDLINNFKERNYINVITKNEEYKTVDGDQGIKIFGSFDDNNKNEKKDYSTILFVIEKLSIKLEIIHKRQNKDLQLVTDRIINSIKFIKK